MRDILFWRRTQNAAIHPEVVQKEGTAREATVTRSPYGDDPLEGLEGDALNRERLAERVANTLSAVAEESDSAVVALIGPWGSGKTSLLNAVERQLGARGGWRVATYNPWLYSTMETAAAGFFSELKSALPEGALADGIRTTLGRLGARMAPVGAVAGLVGFDASGSIRAVAEVVGGDQSPEAMRRRAAEQLRALKSPVLVVLDDLDRLEPEELLLTFKLVRLLGRLPNVYYLLAYDEATLEDVLQRSRLVGLAPGRAREYLEKMVQIRLDIPPLLEAQQLALLNEGLDKCMARHGVKLDADATTRLQQAWSHCLVHYLTQPRAIKKLVAQVDAMWQEVAGEVDFVDFILVTFLRTFERSTFDVLVQSRDELVGYGRYRRSEKETNKETWARWVDRLASVGARRPEDLAVLLSEMFLVLRSARENMTYGSHHAADVKRRRGIGSADFFDRYTQFGVPEDDIADRVVGAALESLASGRTSPELEQLEAKLAQSPGMVIGRLAAHGPGLAVAGPRVIELLSRHYGQAIEERPGLLGMRPEFSMVQLTMELLDQMDPLTASRQLELLGAEPSGLQLSADAVRRALLAEEGEERHPWVSTAAPAVADQIGAYIRSAAQEPIDARGRGVVRLLWNLRGITGEEAAREQAWGALQPEGSWALDDFLALLVPIGVASDGRSTWQSMGDLGEGEIEALLGVERVLERLGDIAPSADSPGLAEDAQGEPTLDRRRAYALNVVRRLAEQRRAEAEQADS